MNKKPILFILLVLTVMNLAVLGTFLFHRFRSCAQARTVHQQIDGFELTKQELSLSAEQIAKFQKFRGVFHAALDTLSAQQNDLRQELIRELAAPAPDRNHLSEINERINRLQFKAQERVIDHLLDVKTILGPEQQTKFLSIILQRLTSSVGPGKYLRAE